MKLASLMMLLCAPLGCRSAGPPPVQTPPAPPLSSYAIGAEDVLEIHVWNNRALSRKVTVRPDGHISLPLVDDVVAAGRTPLDLKANITERLTPYIPNASVSVIVSEVRGRVAVLGDVAHPGRYELRSPTTAVEMLAQAGGLTAFAASSGIVVLRRNGHGTERIVVNLPGTLVDGAANPYLRPGDILFVP